MKKIFTLLLAGFLLLSAASCNTAENSTGTEAVPSAEVTEEASADKAQTEKSAAAGYVCTFDDGTTIEMGAPAEDILAALGDPFNVAEATSCIHEGMDRIYTFNGYTVTTSPDADGNDRIQEVALLSDAVMLEGGVSVGSTLDDAVKIFGSDYVEQFGVIQYTMNNIMVSIILDGDSYITSLVLTVNT